MAEAQPEKSPKGRLKAFIGAVLLLGIGAMLQPLGKLLFEPSPDVVTQYDVNEIEIPADLRQHLLDARLGLFRLTGLAGRVDADMDRLASSASEERRQEVVKDVKSRVAEHDAGLEKIAASQAVLSSLFENLYLSRFSIKVENRGRRAASQISLRVPKAHRAYLAAAPEWTTLPILNESVSLPSLRPNETARVEVYTVNPLIYGRTVETFYEGVATTEFVPSRQRRESSWLSHPLVFGAVFAVVVSLLCYLIFGPRSVVVTVAGSAPAPREVEKGNASHSGPKSDGGAIVGASDS